MRRAGWREGILLFAGILLLGGCSLHGGSRPATQPERKYAEIIDPEQTYAFDVYDPLEEFNRGIYRFNYYFDTFFFLPVVRTYETLLPDYAEARISAFVDNIFEFRNLINNLLQLKGRPAGVTLTRFLVNTTVGVAGFWDRASGMGLGRQQEDLGQTLGRYGVGNGPYLVLPVLGPSNLRDAVGLGGDGGAFALVGPATWAGSTEAIAVFTPVAAVDRRHRQAFRYFQSGSPFEYEMIRMLYTEKRELEIRR